MSKTMHGEMKLELLPQDCVAHILSFTSPRDACRSSLVSSAICHAAESDAVWEKFLPSDYPDILLRLASPLVFKSKKELFHGLCSPILIDDGKKMFWVDKLTCKKCYVLSARELSIKWAHHRLYWRWKPHLQSRFVEVAELITTWWLEINAKIPTQMLSPNTTYAAHLILKITDCAYGLDSLPSEVSVELAHHHERRTVFLRRPKEGRKQRLGEVEQVPREREDGWLEIELGEFYNGGSGEEIRMSLKEVKGVHFRGGLVIEGIELTPKKE